MEELASIDVWISVTVIFTAYLGAMVVAAAANKFSAVPSYPDEVNGILVLSAGIFIPDEYGDDVMLGGGFYTLEALATRFNVQKTIKGAL